MSPDITLTRVETVPAESRVCHYDELDEAAKEQLPLLAASTEAAVDEPIADGFRECDLVKYTDYYEVSVA